MAPRMKIDGASPEPSTPVSPSPAPAKVAATPVAKASSSSRKPAAKVVIAGAPEQEEAPQPATRNATSQAAPSSAPRMVVSEPSIPQESTPVEAPKVAEHSQWDAEPEQHEVGQQGSKRGLLFAPQSAADWVRRTFPGHEHAFYGALIALLLALLVFAIGIWRVLFIVLVVLVGIAVGQVLDGDPKIMRAIRALFSNDHGQQ